MNNPLLEKWITPYETPPFDLIKVGHFKPAVEEAIKQAAEEIDTIVNDASPPDFRNTIEALERSGETLGRIISVLFNLNSAETSKELQAAAQEISPLITRFSNDITLNEKLFSRVKSVWDARDRLSLSGEQLMLLEKRYLGFRLGGAGLDEERKARFRKVSEELSALSLKFEENVLQETNDFELHITDSDDLDGLPDMIREMAAMEASASKKEGWVFTLHFPSYIPFMQYSSKRELRKKMLMAYSSRSFRGNEYDNRELVIKITNLRLGLANILGYRNYAEMALIDRMAEKQQSVEDFLEKLFEASHPAALRDLKNIREFAWANGHIGNIERWDWAWWSEKLKKVKYSIDDELLKPYFNLESVQDAIFGLAGTLYGLKFRELKNIPLYHQEVRTWEVLDGSGDLLAIFYADYHPRAGKSGGAWMTSYREQRYNGSGNIRPFVSIVTNFSRPTDTKPSLLSFGEFTTFLHEFGHSLHAMLSQCTYESLSGTNVARDFVELPSQFMENWAYEKEWLDTWAAHFETGEKIPAEVIAKLKESAVFNEGYACERQLSFGFLDMAWHTLEKPFDGDVKYFETEALKRFSLFPEIESSNMSCSFTHLFGGGYAAGYYGYKWAEVLDADAFFHFREKGIFNREVADSFRKNILEKGGTDKPMNLYIKFRGKEPSIDALLERSGLK
jgi:peptidyl-dipeptidase Dcp